MKLLDRGLGWDQSMKVEDGKLFLKTTQEDGPILELNHQLRLDGGSPMRGWGRMEANIPYADWVTLKKKYPDLSAPDPHLRKKEWERVLRMPENRKFLTVNTKGR